MQDDEMDIEDDIPENAIFALTPWGCLSAVLDDYGIPTGNITATIGKHMVEDFMDLMCKAGHVKKAEESK